MQIQGRIDSVIAKRSGSSFKNGRNIPWTIYEVTINGQKFDTFDNTYQSMVGQQGSFDYEQSNRVNNGRTYTTNRLANIQKKESQGSVLAEKLNQILTNQEEMLGLLRSLGQEVPLPEDTISESDQEIDVSKIPF